MVSCRSACGFPLVNRRGWRSRLPRALSASSVLPLLSMVLLVPPVYFIVRWIRIFNEIGVHEERVAEFGSVLPRVLQDPLASTLFAVACAATAGALGAVGLIRLSGLCRLLCAATLGLGVLLSLLFFWTLL